MPVYSGLFLQHKIPHAFGTAGELAPGGARHLKQTHGVLTHCVDNIIATDSEGDGVYSYAKNICAIKTADCVPVLVASRKRNFYAAIHAGWRGICSEIIPIFLQKISNSEKDDLIFAIGPCISWNHFEVGPEVVAEFLQKNYFTGAKNQWLKPGAFNKSMIDL